MTTEKSQALSLLVILITVIPLTQQQLLPPQMDEEMFRCENLTVITMCRELYPMAAFPNFQGHQTQEAANNELLNYFAPLIRSVCSNAIVHFLCSVYAPFCQRNIRVRPCRELCEHVWKTCEDDLRQLNLTNLECFNFQLDSITNLDFCPDNLTALRIPSNVLTDPLITSGIIILLYGGVGGVHAILSIECFLTSCT